MQLELEPLVQQSRQHVPVLFLCRVPLGLCFDIEACIIHPGRAAVHLKLLDVVRRGDQGLQGDIPAAEAASTIWDQIIVVAFGRGGALKPSWYGDCLPSRDFPMLIDLYLQGRLDLDRFVSETIPLDAVEDAFHKMERGEVLRSVVVL